MSPPNCQLNEPSKKLAVGASISKILNYLPSIGAIAPAVLTRQFSTYSTMRRVTRLKRPSGLTATTAANVSRSTTSNISHPQRSAHFSSSSSSTTTTTTHTLLPQRRPIARSLCPSSLNRFYSSDKKSESKSESQAETETPTPTPVQEPVKEPVQESVQEPVQKATKEVTQEATQQQEQQDQIQSRREDLEAEIKAKPLPADADADADKLLVSELETSTALEEFTTSDNLPPTPALSSLYATPPPRALAAREDEVADPTYTPASTSAGLKTVGGLKGWWDKPENWRAGGDFVGFRPRQKVTEPALLEAAVRRAVIEAFALRKAGREDELVAVWPVVLHKGEAQGVLAREVKGDGEGGVLFARGDEDVEVVVEGLRWQEDGMDVVVSKSGSESVGVEVSEGEGEKEKESGKELTAGEAAALSQSWDPSWKTIRLEDARIRFAVGSSPLCPFIASLLLGVSPLTSSLRSKRYLINITPPKQITKRIFQLTGQRIHDHQLESATTVQTILHMIKKPPKPVTLMEEIEKRHPSLLDLPNVTVSGKRVTKGDKEKALGRYKVMQEEFKKRELPGVGHGYARKGKEIQRLHGNM